MNCTRWYFKPNLRVLDSIGSVGRCGRDRAAGFSLLEVIVAMALATVLLGSVWSLFQILTKRQAIELRQAESNQLIRSLHQRFTRDLNNLPAIETQVGSALPKPFGREALPEGSRFWPFNILDKQPPEVPAAAAAVLRGDQTSLTLAQFVEPCQWQEYQTSGEEYQASDDQPRRGALASKTPPLIKEVRYQLPRWPMPEDEWVTDSLESQLDSVEHDDAEPPSPMLVREERLSGREAAMANPSVRRLPSADDDFSDRKTDRKTARQRPPMQDASDEAAEAITATDQRETLEDISVAAFAYFDGRRWRSEWDTDFEQRLPVAIRFRWRQTAIPTAESGEMSSDFSTALPPEELSGEESDIESDLVELGTLESNWDAADESPDSRWYEGEWIFLLQPAKLPADLPAESKFGVQRRSNQRFRAGVYSELRNAGGRHG